MHKKAKVLLGIFLSLIIVANLIILSGCSSKLNTNTDSVKKEQTSTDEQFTEQKFLLTTSNGKAAVISFKATDDTFLRPSMESVGNATLDIVINDMPLGEVNLLASSNEDELENYYIFNDNVDMGTYFGLEGMTCINDFDTPIGAKYYNKERLYVVKCSDGTAIEVSYDATRNIDMEGRMKIGLPDSSFGGGNKTTDAVMYVDNASTNSGSNKIEFNITGDENWGIGTDDMLNTPIIAYNGGEVAKFSIRDIKRYKTLSEDLAANGTVEEGQYFGCPGEKAVVESLDGVYNNAYKTVRYIINVDNAGIVDLRCPEWASGILEKNLIMHAASPKSS